MYIYVYIFYMYVMTIVKDVMDLKGEVWKEEREWVNDLVIISKKLSLFMILEMNALLGSSIWMEEAGCWEHWGCVFEGHSFPASFRLLSLPASDRPLVKAMLTCILLP